MPAAKKAAITTMKMRSCMNRSRFGDPSYECRSTGLGRNHVHNCRSGDAPKQAFQPRRGNEASHPGRLVPGAAGGKERWHCWFAPALWCINFMNQFLSRFKSKRCQECEAGHQESVKMVPSERAEDVKACEERRPTRPEIGLAGRQTGWQ
jgi:hypothetical protein